MVKRAITQKKAKQRYAGLVRRQIFAKTLTKLILQNNNSLLITNIVNTLWRARTHFTKSVSHVAGNVGFLMKNGGCKNLSLPYSSSRLTTAILILTTTSH